jgi:hypothetical protein
VFRNTILAQGAGIRMIRGDPAYRQVAVGNAVFAAEPIVGLRADANVTDSLSAAGAHLLRPQAAPGALDVTARVGKLSGAPLAVDEFLALPNANRDFDGRIFDDRARGAFRSSSGPRPIALKTRPVVETGTAVR